MYVIYQKDVKNSAIGRLIGTIIGPDETYGPNELTPRNQEWIFLAGAMNIDPRITYVDIEMQSVKEFEAMHLIVDKIEFIADNEDFATVSGIPSGSTVVVKCDGTFMQSCVVNDESKIEIASETPASYDVQVSCFPYHPASISFKSIDKPKPVALPAGQGFAMSVMPDYSK